MPKPFDPSHAKRFICLVLFFDAMGVGLILPVMPELIRELSDRPVEDAARIGGYLLLCFAGMQFLCAPLLGALSDRFGRRPVLLLALLGFSADYFLMAMAPTLGWLFAARLVSGIFGATYPAATAAMADISSPGQRAGDFGLVGASIGLGFVVGPAFGGLLG
ncbi:MAG: MFS transporter, partial [Pseudomonadota bacterium]